MEPVLSQDSPLRQLKDFRKKLKKQRPKDVPVLQMVDRWIANKKLKHETKANSNATTKMIKFLQKVAN